MQTPIARSLFALAAAGLIGGCGAIDTLDDPDALMVAPVTLHERIEAVPEARRDVLTPPVVGERALVRDDAALFGDHKQVGVLGSFGEVGVGGLVAVEVVAVDAAADRVLVERTEARRAECWSDPDHYAPRGLDAAYRWQAWVDTASLSAVVREPFALAFADGTAIDVGAGVVAAAGVAGGERVWAISRGDGHPFVDLAAPVERLGLSYPERTVELGDRPSARLVAPTLDGRPWPMVDPDGRAAQVVADTAGFVRVGDGCIAARVRVDHVSWDLSGRCGGGRGYGFGTLSTWTIEAGAQASWPDGTPAGETRDPVVHTTEPARIDDRLCFSLAFFGGPDQTGQATICHAGDDVTPPTWPGFETVEMPPLVVQPLDAQVDAPSSADADVR